MVDVPRATGSTYQAFSKDFASYQEVNAQAGPSKTTVHLDSQLPQDVVLDEDSGLVGSLMRSLENQRVKTACLHGQVADDAGYGPGKVQAGRAKTQ
jgi:hypothetical protein